MLLFSGMGRRFGICAVFRGVGVELARFCALSGRFRVGGVSDIQYYNIRIYLYLT